MSSSISDNLSSLNLWLSKTVDQTERDLTRGCNVEIQKQQKLFLKIKIKNKSYSRNSLVSSQSKIKLTKH